MIAATVQEEAFGTLDRLSGGERPNTDCQRRRSASPDNDRTRAISASTEAASTNRCSMSGRLRLGFVAVADLGAPLDEGARANSKQSSPTEKIILPGPRNGLRWLG